MKKSIIFIGTGLFLLSISCTTESDAVLSNSESLTIEEQVLSMHHSPFETKSEMADHAMLMKEILILSKSSNFRKELFDQSLEQKTGDYEMVLTDLSEQSRKKMLDDLRDNFLMVERLASQITEKGKNAPVIFFPKAETLERKLKQSKSMINSGELGEPIAVFRDVYDDNYDSPGYVLDENNELVYSHMVSEEEAYTTDVYVVGNAEFIQYPDPWAGGGGETGGGSGGYGGGSGSSDTRIDGRAEYGGIFQITDLNEVEHWTWGKLEMTVVVASMSGGIIVNKPYPKRARDNYRDNRWADKNDFFYNWNTSNLGMVHVEKWIERDGGDSAEISIKLPAEDGYPETTIKIPSQDEDDDLGSSVVQFSDNIGQVYSLGLLNFKRK